MDCVTTALFGSDNTEVDRLIKERAIGVAVVGFGYIGTVIGAVLADCRWRVTGIDVRQTVVDEINAGHTTHVREPHLDELIAANVEAGRLRATTDFSVIADNDIVIVTVGTPLGPDFEPIVDDIEAAAKSVAQHLHKGHLVVLKSTVPLTATPGLAAEGVALGPVAMGVIVWFEVTGAGTLVALGPGHLWLLLAAGPVTALPLLLYGAAARRVPLSTIGVLMYVNPTLQFLWGVLVVGEQMSPLRWAGFALVWTALVVFTVDLVRAARSPRGEPAPAGA